jgi:hypothetical protein
VQRIREGLDFVQFSTRIVWAAAPRRGTASFFKNLSIQQAGVSSCFFSKFKFKFKLLRKQQTT